MTCTTELPQGSFIRLKTIIGDRKKGKPGLLPIGPSTWWAGVKSGRYPQPVKLGPRITAWRVEDIRALTEDAPVPVHVETVATT